MTAQFAGSRSLDDRRRRRLAQESGEEIAPPSPKKQPGKARSPENSEVSVQAPLVTDVVAEESLIPSRLWKVIAYGVTGVIIWSGLLWANFQELTIDGLERLLSPVYGNAFRFFSTVSLMLVSQLSFTIWWYRSRSRKDFGGRYRIWAWAGSFWAMACIANGVGLHEPLAQLTYEQWPIHSWRPELLYWFVPFSIGVLALHQLISLDMRHSRASRFLWNTALACGVGAAGLKLGLDLSLPASVRDLAVSGSACLWHFLLSFTLLFHARFVVHVTNEAAPRGTSRFARTKLVLLERIARLRAKFLTNKSKSKSSRSKSKSADKRAERRKLKEVAKAKRVEARELAWMEKQEAIAQKKAERDAAQEEKVAEKQKRAAQKVALAEEKKAERERSRAEVIANKQAATKKRAGSSQGSPQSQPSKPAAKPSPSTPEAKTASGKKRKRVLGNNTRVDAPQEAKAPHSEHRAEPKKPRKKATNQSCDDYYEEDDDDFSGMSKKERRRARKKQRQRDNN